MANDLATRSVSLDIQDCKRLSNNKVLHRRFMEESTHLSVYSSICSLHLSIHSSVHPTVPMFLHAFIFLSVCPTVPMSLPSTCLFLCVCPSILLSFFPSIYPPNVFDAMKEGGYVLSLITLLTVSPANGLLSPKNSLNTSSASP